MINIEKTKAEIKELNVMPQQWVSKYADYLYAYSIARINDAEMAQDLVQETFLAALEKLDKFEGRSSEKTWLTSILKYKIIDIYRSRNVGSALANTRDSYKGFADFFQQEDGHWNVPDRPQEFGMEDANIIENKEFHNILGKCMQKLPSLWKSLFIMKFLDDECTDIICNELSITPANYWVIVHRTKVNLRACLQKHWGYFK